MNAIVSPIERVEPTQTAVVDPVLDVAAEKTYQRLAEQIVALISGG